jgi:hypothetical protein
MQPIEIIAAAGASSLVLFTVVYNVIRKKQGKTGCDCGSKCNNECNECPYAKNCPSKNKTIPKE